MPTHYTDVEKLLLQRWPDVRALLVAYGELEDSIDEMFGEVGEELETWARSRGYSLDTDAKKAEFHFWKESWANRRNEAGVWLAVGGFAPEGYRKVRDPHPYIWVYTDCEKLRIKASLHDPFKNALLAAVGDKLAEWRNEDVDDTAPLGKHLRDYDDSQRIQWMLSPASLSEFVKTAFDQLVLLEEPIDRVVKNYR